MFNFFTTVTEEQAKNMNAVTLAFVGDAVYSLYVREKLALTYDYPTGTLQNLSTKEVSARGQSELLKRIMHRFTNDELAIFKRGRNAKKYSRSKNATVSEYNNSTGFEAVLGYLYILGRYSRIDELLEQ